MILQFKMIKLDPHKVDLQQQFGILIRQQWNNPSVLLFEQTLPLLTDIQIISKRMKISKRILQQII